MIPSTSGEAGCAAKSKVVKPRNFQERSVPKFLKKVFQILEENKHNELMSWTADGLAVVIKKPTEFAEKVLPLYFKHNNFASFIRQLNMYKFKKKKTYQYDHVYLHEMFQRGRIDLLRNIQRKTTDAPMMASTSFEMKTYKEDVEVDVDNLLQENLHYKRIHKTLTTQVHFIESKMKDLRQEISTLYAEQQQSQANEQFLKKIVKNLTRVFGYENIERVIEAIDAEQTGSPSYNSSESYNQSSPAKMYAGQSKVCHSPNIYEEDSCTGKDYSHTCDYEPISNEFAHTTLAIPSQYDSYPGKSLTQQELEIRNMFNKDESEEQVDSAKSTISNTYNVWLKDFEKKKKRAEAFLGQANGHLGGLDIDDLYHRTEF